MKDILREIYKDDIVQILKDSKGRGEPARDLPLLPVPSGQRRLVSFFHKGGEATTVEYSNEKEGEQEFLRMIAGEGRDAEDILVLIQYIDPDNADVIPRVDIDFKNPLTYLEMSVIEGIIKNYRLPCCWIWGRNEDGKPVLITVFLPGGELSGEGFIERIGTVKEILGFAGYEVGLKSISINYMLIEGESSFNV